MCRLLAVKSEIPVSISLYLDKLSEIAKRSFEYQGHGWGIVYFQDGKWHEFKKIDPIWESTYSHFGESTLFLAHARSAYKDELIDVKYNMPYRNSQVVFAFNGELQGVRIRSDGDIGAQKLFNYILRFEKKGWKSALELTKEIISKRSDYVRAMNIIMTDREKLYISSLFNENSEYYTMYYSIQNGVKIVSSEKLRDNSVWNPVLNGETLVIA